MRFAFLIIIVASSLAVVMSRKPPIESLSCRSIVNDGELCEFKTCPPCWEQSHWSSNFYTHRGLSTIGTCHRLHPSKVEGWKAIKPDGKYWSDTKWKGLVANGKNHYLFYRVNNTFLIVLTLLFSSEADSPPKKRHRKPAVHFKPSQVVKTNVERQTSYINSKWKRDRIKFESESDLSNLVDEMKSFPRKMISETILAPLLEHAAETKDGRFGIAKAISKKAKINLPTGGNSKSALNRAKQTAGHLMGGLATILDPDNPDRLKSLMTGKRKLEMEHSSAVATAMNPRNPKLLNVQAVLPERYRDPAEEEPSVENIAALLTDHDDDDDDGSVSSKSSSSDSDSSYRARRRQVRKTAHLKAKKHFRRKLNRKSMTYKSVQQETKAIAAVRESLGAALIEHLKNENECKTVRERRPILALVAHKHKRKDVIRAIGLFYISKHEWRLAKIHAIYPGPLKPVKKKLIRRLKIAKELLFKLLNFLKSPGNLQRSAFGSQLKECLGGSYTVEMDNVARTKKAGKLLTDYITAIFQELEVITTKDGESIPESTECRCKQLDQKTFRRCLKGHKHDGKCAFTPDGSICASTVQSLIESLTAGDIKSLSGLDDVKVLKGRDNFKALREIANIVCSPEEVDAMVKAIDDAELYHQTDFVPHLERSGSHKCNCTTCGFNCEGELDVV
jgi:hypothetical protein